MSRQNIIVKHIVFTMSSIAALFSLTGFILLGAVGYGIGAIVSAACAYGIYRTKKPVTVVHFTGIILLALALTFTQPLKGIFAWQYGFQKLYIEKAAGFHADGFFPDKLTGCSGSFRSEFMPSIMQGDGWFIISYDTDSVNTCKEYLEYNSEVKFKAAEERDGYSESTEKALGKFSKNKYPMIYFKLPDEVSDEADVYILKAEIGHDYTHAELAIVDGNRVYLIKQ